jgi:hypothetical protein
MLEALRTSNDGIVVEYELGVVDDLELGQLDQEVATYHQDFRPRLSADFVWLRYHYD